MASDRDVVANLAAVWRSISDLLSGLDDKDWDRPTDCPGWTVKDQVSHLIGTESSLLGRPSPPPVAPETAPHAKNPMGLHNEAWVQARRDRPPADVLAEFREVTDARLASMRAMTDEQMAALTVGPMGETPYEEFMRLRTMDNWVHEQDIRRAVGEPGHVAGPVVEASLARFTSAMPFVVGKRAAPPDGTTVVLHLTGPVDQTVAAAMRGSRANPVASPATDWTVRLTMDPLTYMRLTCGRETAADALVNDQVRVEGDRALGERVLAGMSIMP